MNVFLSADFAKIAGLASKFGVAEGASPEFKDCIGFSKRPVCREPHPLEYPPAS